MLFFSIVLLLCFGECDFSKLRVKGPYEVGFVEFKTKLYGNAVSCFYPIDKEEYRKKIKDHNPLWARNGQDTTLGIAKASGGYNSKNHYPAWVFKYFLRVKLNVI